MREMASVLRYSTAVDSGQPRPPRAVCLGWKVHGMKAVKPPVSSWRSVDVLEVIDAVLFGFADAEHHGGSGLHAQIVGGAVDVEPVLGGALEAGDLGADLVVENLGAAAGDRLQSGIHEAADGLFKREIAVLGDAEDFAGGEAVQMHLRKALLDAAEERLEPVDFEIGMNAALHEHTGAAHLDGFGDLLVDLIKVEEVALFAARTLDGRIEGAERAVLGADVGVIDVAVDDVADNAVGMKLAADGVGFHADADQIIGAEHFESLFVAKAHTNS